MKGEPENPMPRAEHAAKVKTLIDSSPHENVRDYARGFTKVAGALRDPPATSAIPKMRYFLFTARPNPLEDITVLGARPKMFEGEPRTEEGFTNMPLIMKDGRIYKNTLE